MTGGWQVRAIRADDGAKLRRLRLEALADTPMAFHEVYADAATLDDQAWRNRAASNVDNPERVGFVAEDTATGDWLGMMGCYLDANDGPTVVAVFVTPAARGSAVADALLAAVEKWAVAGGHRTLSLFVHENNAAANRLYERNGFADTGRRAAYPHPPGGYERTMVKQLR